jgi:hypothetical protein
MKGLMRSCSLIVLVLAFGALSFAQDKDDDNVSRTKSFTVAKGGQLILSVDGGDLRITPWEKDEVDVTVRGSDESDLDGLHM